MGSQKPTELYPPWAFRRQDESDDHLFYTEPRLAVHVDGPAIRAIGAFFAKALPRDGVLLDLMSSWRSHLPQDFLKRKLVGLGLNAKEMAENPQLDDGVLHDLNINPQLPFQDQVFDAAMVTVSIQYMRRPVEVFKEVHRVLKGGAPFHVVYSNRMFPTKAVAIWQMLNDTQRAQLIASYFLNAGGWEQPQTLDLTPRLSAPSGYTDPVFVVTARKRADG